MFNFKKQEKKIGGRNFRKFMGRMRQKWLSPIITDDPDTDGGDVVIDSLLVYRFIVAEPCTIKT